jgi:hypothetical protein
MKTPPEGSLHIYIVSMRATEPRWRLTLRRLVVRVTRVKRLAARGKEQLRSAQAAVTARQEISVLGKLTVAPER